MSDMKYQEDEFYISQVLNGKVQAYAFLVNKHKNMVFTLAYRMVKSREDAEEVAQDVFLKAFQCLDTFKGDSRFSTWLYRIVYNNSVNRIRKNKSNAALTDFIEDDDFYLDSDELQQLREKERKLYVKEAIDHLEEEDGFIVTLFYLEELTSASIAEITGLEETNVRVKLHRSRRKMHAYLQNRLQKEIKEIL